MKNSIKIIVTLGLATSFFPVYSMESPLMEVDYFLKIDDLKNINPLSEMNKLPIYWYSCTFNSMLNRIPNNDPLLTDEGLAFRLTTLKIFLEPDPEKNYKTFGRIYTSVILGGPVASNHVFEKVNYRQGLIVKLSPTSFSVFQDIEQFMQPGTEPKTIAGRDNINKTCTKKEEACNANYTGGRGLKRKADVNGEEAHSKKHRKKFHDPEKTHGGLKIHHIPVVQQLMTTIFQGKRNGQEQLAHTLITCVNNELKIDISEDLMLLIFSYLKKNKDKESAALIEQAEQKFNENIF